MDTLGCLRKLKKIVFWRTYIHAYRRIRSMPYSCYYLIVFSYCQDFRLTVTQNSQQSQLTARNTKMFPVLAVKPWFQPFSIKISMIVRETGLEVEMSTTRMYKCWMFTSGPRQILQAVALCQHQVRFSNGCQWIVQVLIQTNSTKFSCRTPPWSNNMEWFSKKGANHCHWGTRRETIFMIVTHCWLLTMINH